MKKFIPAFLLFVSLALIKQMTEAQTNQWRPVSGSQQDNISGMALIEHTAHKTSFLIVEDNKKPRQNRAAVLSIEGHATPKYTTLRWLGDDIPIDLEVVTSVPDAANNVMALASSG